MIRLVKIFLISVLLTGAMSAQEFTATVDKTTVGQNERFQVYFEFKGSDTNGLSDFAPPTFQGFKVLSGPNQSTSMQIINGSVSASISYSYYLTATDIGKFTIGSASIEYKGTKYSTEPITITVVKGQASPATQQQDDSGISQEEIGENVFILAQADRNSVYKGEQVTVTYKLYTRLEISSPQISKLPTYEGFWAEELDAISNLRFEIEMYQGKRYRTATLKRVALFPTKSGELSVTPFELNIPVIVKKRNTGRDLFDDFFNDSFFGRRETIDHLARSNRIKVNVKELPTASKPDSFNGAVGNFNFSAKLDKTEAETNEPITLRVNINGTGNIKLLDLPEVELPVGFEQYEPKTSESINRRGQISGTKSAEYILVPRIAGEKVIKPVEFSYFNPRTGKYVTLTSPEFNLSIKRGASAAEPSISGYTKEDVKLLSEDIRFIKTSDFNFRKVGELKTIQSWFWYSLALPLVIFIAFLSIKNRQSKLSGNVMLMKYQKAEKLARQRLKAAKKAIDNSDQVLFYNELSSALFGYLEDKLGLQRAEFTQEKVLLMLEQKKVKPDLVNHVKEILDKCEFARFAPQKSTNEIALRIYEDTVKTIVELEGSIVLGK